MKPLPDLEGVRRDLELLLASRQTEIRKQPPRQGRFRDWLERLSWIGAKDIDGIMQQAAEGGLIIADHYNHKTQDEWGEWYKSNGLTFHSLGDFYRVAKNGSNEFLQALKIMLREWNLATDTRLEYSHNVAKVTQRHSRHSTETTIAVPEYTSAVPQTGGIVTLGELISTATGLRFMQTLLETQDTGQAIKANLDKLLQGKGKTEIWMPWPKQISEGSAVSINATTAPATLESMSTLWHPHRLYIHLGDSPQTPHWSAFGGYKAPVDALVKQLQEYFPDMMKKPFLCAHHLVGGLVAQRGINYGQAIKQFCKAAKKSPDSFPAQVLLNFALKTFLASGQAERINARQSTAEWIKEPRLYGSDAKVCALGQEYNIPTIAIKTFLNERDDDT